MRGERALSKNYSEMSKTDGKRNQRYVDHPRYQSKLTCLIHGHGHSSDECNVLNGFGSKYTKIRPTKEVRQDIVFKKTFGI